MTDEPDETSPLFEVFAKTSAARCCSGWRSNLPLSSSVFVTCSVFAARSIDKDLVGLCGPMVLTDTAKLRLIVSETDSQRLSSSAAAQAAQAAQALQAGLEVIKRICASKCSRPVLENELSKPKVEDQEYSMRF